MRRAVWVILPLVAVLLACGSSEPPASRALVRDSAGVTIVENTAPLTADSIAFLVDSVPAVEIGGSDDPHTEFGRVAGAVHLPGGRIVVADGGTNELRFFDSAGAWLRTAGRKGGGPGEFEQLGGLFRLGDDSLATYDWDHRRISVFTVRGDLVRDATLSQGNTDAGFVNVFGVLADGDFLVLRQRFGGGTEQSGLQRDTLTVFRYTREAVLDSIGRFAGSEVYLDIQYNSGGRISSVMSTMLPFGLTLTLKAAERVLYVGAGERYEIAQYDRAGKLVRLIRRAHASAPVTSSDIATMKERRLEGFRPGSEAVRDRVKQLLERMTFPTIKPAYDGFVAGDDGALWVRRYDQPAVDLPVYYDLFDRDGQWLGHATFPPRFMLHQAGPGFALGVWKDPDDVEYVRLYRLRPAQ